MTPRIERAINVFLDAINNGTLAKATCAACAVGNLVAAGMKIKPIIPDSVKKDESEIVDNEHWMYRIIELREGRVRPYYILQNPEKADRCIAATEFNLKELNEIERAFEMATVIYFEDYSFYSKERIREDQINGLAAVVKVMLEFDDCKDSVEEVFTKRAELIPIES